MSFLDRTIKPLALAAATAMPLALSTSAFAQDDVIKLGSAISFTGKYSTNGVHAKNGYDLAVEKINDIGGVKIGDKNYLFEIVYYDDESTPARTAQLVERLIQQDGVKFVLGPYSSATTKAAASVTEKYQVPMVEAEDASRALFLQGYRYVFAVLSTSEQYLASAVTLAGQMAEKMGRSPRDLTVALAFEDHPFSLDVRAGVIEDTQELGMQVVIDDKLPRAFSDMSATLSKVQALKPDVLLVSGHSKGATTAARQIAEMKIDVPIIAVTHCEAAKIDEEFPEAVNDFLCPTQWAETLAYEDSLFGTAANYDKIFKETYPYYKSVPYQSAQATAAVMVWKDAFERAQSLDPEKVRDALAATDMKTFYGPIKFSEAGNNIAKPMVLRQIQDGTYNVVAPVEWAPHELNFPREAPE